MKKWIRYLAGVVAVTALLAVVTDAGADTCKLEIKKVEARKPGGPRQDYMFRYAYPQRFFKQIGGPQGIISAGSSADKNKPEFSKVIKKELAKYVAEHPFRGVVKLGSQYYGFVFDAAPPTEAEKKKAAEEKQAAETKKDADKKKSDSEAKAKAKKPKADNKNKPSPKAIYFCRLYFDLNHNGDLTDDKVIEADTNQRQSNTSTSSSFPRVDLTIDVDGTKMDYAFTMRVSMQANSRFSYARAQLTAAAYREGEITLDGKKYRVVVVDFNSNGMFNDESKVNDNIRRSNGVVYPTQGDRLFVIDPKAGKSSGSPYDVSANDALHYVAKLVNFGGRFHDLTISPVGNELQLAPSSIPVGHVTNPNKGYRAIVYGKQGFLKVVGDKSGKSPLPEGEWKLLSYTIDQTEKPEPEKPEPEKPKAEAKVKAKTESKADTKDKTKAKAEVEAKLKDREEAIKKARPRPTTIAARATKDYKAVKVVKDKTVALPFGSPYRPVVSVQYRQGDGKVSLGMSLVAPQTRFAAA